MEMYPLMQYYDVTTDPRWRTAAMLKTINISAKKYPILVKFGTQQQIW